MEFLLTWGRKRHHIPILLEIDVTVARNAIRDQKKMGQSVSFTGWIVKCLAQAVSEHQSIQAIRKENRQLVIFEDVDVSIIVERAVGQPDEAETLPMPYVVRRANEKTLATIHAEIRAAQQLVVSKGEVQIDSPRAAWLTHIFTKLPRFVRDLFFWQPLDLLRE